MTDVPLEASAITRMQAMLSGFAVSQALYVIAELDVATRLLDGPRAVADLATATGADQDALRRIIRYLSTLGVFGMDSDTVTLTDLGRTLADGPVGSFRGLARYWMSTHYDPFADLLHTARTGQTGATHYLGMPFFDWINESSGLAELQNAAMAGGGHASRGDLLQTYRLPPGRMVADIGGADGTLLTALIANEPDRDGIVFDLPSVVTTAHATVASAGLAGRVGVVAGDFFDSVPTADVYVMSVVLHDWDDEASLRILGNIGQAATPGARLVLLETVLPENGDPSFGSTLDLVMLAITGGRERTETEWRDLLAKGGFTVDRITAGSGLFSVIEATLN